MNERDVPTPLRLPSASAQLPRSQREALAHQLVDVLLTPCTCGRHTPMQRLQQFIDITRQLFVADDSEECLPADNTQAPRRGACGE